MHSRSLYQAGVCLLALVLFFAAAAGAQDIIVDNDSGAPAYTETGSWATSGSTGYNGGTYRFSTSGGAHTATWTASLPSAEEYEVSVFYRAGTNRTTATKYTISTASGPQVVLVDQTQNNLVWVSLGTFSFNAGNATVIVDASASTPAGAVVVADAVKFTPPVPPPPADPAEMRIAIMTVFDSINSTTAIQNWVNEISSLHYNAIAIHARYRGDATYFPNKLDATFPNSEPRSSSAGSIDVIEEFTTRAHAKGIKVFAYVNAWLVTDGANSDSRPSHVVNVHPDWRTYAYNNGNPVVQTTTHDGEGLWLDPALPDARANVAAICGDIMMNYDVDGIMLDRIRYPQTGFTRTSKDFGYHPDAIAAFHAQYGGAGVPNPSDANWIKFRQDQITASVQSVYNTITAINPDNILLAYPLGRFNDALNYNYQDWPTWMNSGVIDGVLPQIYTSNNSTFATVCDQHLAAYGGSRLFGVTLQTYLSGIDVAGQIQITRDKGFDGTSPYRHGSMGALGYFNDLQVKWPGIAPWPDMPWKQPDTTPPAAPTGLVANAGNAVVLLDWNDNSESDLATYRIYRSTTPGGGYALLQSNLTSSVYTDNAVLNDTAYYYVVTAFDTANNESANSNEASATPTAGTPVEVIADNDNGSPVYSETGAWTTSGSPGYNGGTYRFASVGGSHSATWTAALAAGTYQVSVIYVAGANRATAAQYSISTAAGTQNASINQQVNNLTWVPLGTFSINGGNNTVTLNAATSSGGSVVIADAVRWTPVTADTTPPAAPTGLAATAGNATVSLDWANNGEGDLAGYNVYRSTTSGGGYAKINGALVLPSAYTDNSVSNGTTYYYIVTAVDTSNNESGNSNQASATPQQPAPTTMHVSAVAASTAAAPKGQKFGVATVTIVNNNGQPVANATVTGNFTGSWNETRTGVTNASGQATIQTATSKKNPVFTFCVTNVTHGTLTYAPGDNLATCASN